ncbi:MAG: copper amine oxidase N-terminal domain-containing protein [Pelotomaculaceae bacterium]|jgi:hypothetical protein|nr:copper amine oxidase N-terminal domain-containing protein [Bacillota bacterium]
MWGKDRNELEELVVGTEGTPAGFDGELKDLTSGKYYYRAYATNEGGTSYGKLKEFTITGTSSDPGTDPNADPDTVPDNGHGAVRVILNGRTLQFDVPPIIENDRTLVPLRVIFEALGAGVEWDGATQTVRAERDGTIIKLVIGGKAYVNDQPVELDVPAKIVNDRTLVPLRFVSEALGCRVEWFGDSMTVSITS